jgi:hypothetical protein
MSRISRDSFVDKMTRGEGGIDIDQLSRQTQDALANAGIDKEKLVQVAGEDGIINGPDEMSDLFTLVDTADRNRSFNSIATTNKDGSATASGALYAALKGELERARLGAPGGARTESAPAKVEARAADRVGTNEFSDKWFNRKDVATDAQRDKAISSLEAQGFRDIHLPRNGAYYAQVDNKRWALEPYPKHGLEPGPERTIASAGCAPASLAMADATLRGTRTTPPEVADFAVRHGASGDPKKQGTDTGKMVRAWADERHLDLDVVKNMDDLRKGLEAGGVALVSVGKNDKLFSPGGHVMCVNGYAVDKDGKEWFFLANPGRQSAKDDPRGIVVDEGLHHGAGRVRVSREALEKYMGKAWVLSNPA